MSQGSNPKTPAYQEIKLYIYENIGKLSKDEIYKNLLLKNYGLVDIDTHFVIIHSQLNGMHFGSGSDNTSNENQFNHTQNLQITNSESSPSQPISPQVQNFQTGTVQDLNSQNSSAQNQNFQNTNPQSESKGQINIENQSAVVAENTHSQEIAVNEKSNQKTGENDTNTSKMPKYVYTISIFGSVLVGLGFLSLVAANWSAMGDFVKVFVITSFMIFFYVLGFIMDYMRIKWLSDLFMLIGCFIFGANIFLFSQIFNLPINWQDGFLHWFSGSVWIALAMKQKIVAIASFFMLVVGFPGIIFGYLNPSNVISDISNNMSYFAMVIALITSLTASCYFYRARQVSFDNLSSKMEQN